MTISADGGIPVQFRCEDGNRSDVDTHIETREPLRRVARTPDFLHVADSKLCVTGTMDYTAARKGRFVTVLLSAGGVRLPAVDGTAGRPPPHPRRQIVVY